ncbi:MAG TPA: 6-bladed beta-propeller [Edaphocola sp.]|nr:6-bladed beta-propeller [Edaphocola sp.]
MSIREYRRRKTIKNVHYTKKFNNLNLFIINSEGNVIHEAAPFPIELRNVLYGNQPFFKHKNQVSFSNPTNRSVYVLRKDELEVQRILFDFGDLNIKFPETSGKEIAEINFNEMVNRMTSLNRILDEYSGIFGPVSFMETDSHIAIECIKDGQNIYIFYCKESLKSVIIKPEDILVYGLPMTFLNMISVSPDGKSFICMTSSYRIKDICRSLSSNDAVIIDKDLALINKQIKESDNPVLIRFELTKF